MLGYMGEKQMVETCTRLLSGLIVICCLVVPASAFAASGTFSLRMAGGERLYVFVDGERVGKTPLEIDLAPGSHTLELKVSPSSVTSVKSKITIRSSQTTFLVGNWETGTFEEDLAASQGAVRLMIALQSREEADFPGTVADSLWGQVSLSVSCGKVVSEPGAELTVVDDAVLTRAQLLKGLPQGKCKLDVIFPGATVSTAVDVQAGKTSEASVKVKVPWAQVSVTRVIAGDRVDLLMADSNGSPQRITVTTKPKLVVPGPAEMVVVRDGTDRAASRLSRVGGSVQLEPYGRTETTVTLVSGHDAPFPEELADEFWSELATALSCDGSKVPASTLEVKAVEGSALERLVIAEPVPPGECDYSFELGGVEAVSQHVVRSDKTSSTNVSLPVHWAQVRLSRVLDGDRVELRPTGSGEKSVALGLEPKLVRSPAASVILLRRGEEFEVAKIVDPAGSVIVDPYGVLLLPEELRVEGLVLEINGKGLKAEPEVVLPVGTWEVSLKAPGRHPATKTLAIKSGGSQTWGANLASVKPASLSLAVTGPTNWQWSINGKEQSDSSPVELAPGTYEVSVSARGWEPQTQKIELVEGQVLNQAVELSASLAAVRFSGLLRGAEVTIEATGGKEKAFPASGSELSVRLAPGTYRWTAKAKGRVSADGEVSFSPGDEVPTIQVELPWSELSSLKRKNGVRTALLAGISGALAVPGIVLMVDGRDLYAFADEQNEKYLAAVGSSDIVEAREIRDQAVARGTQELVGGTVLVVAAACAAGATVLSAALGKRKESTVSVSLIATPRNAAFAVVGRW
jgi:hypothetical protein